MTRLALKEDQTTTGGRVLGGSSDSYAEDGRRFVLDGDKATCGNCKGLWPILGSAHDWMDRGRSMVRDLDPVLCPCGKNRVFASGNSPFDYETGGSSGNTAAVAQPPLEVTHWIGFRLAEKGNCQGLKCVAHFADGSGEYGTFGEDNSIRFERANNGNTCERIELMSCDGASTSGSVAESILSIIAG